MYGKHLNPLSYSLAIRSRKKGAVLTKVTDRFLANPSLDSS